jgi:hypothetical protein
MGNKFVGKTAANDDPFLPSGNEYSDEYHVPKMAVMLPSVTIPSIEASYNLFSRTVLPETGSIERR